MNLHYKKILVWIFSCLLFFGLSGAENWASSNFEVQWPPDVSKDTQDLSVPGYGEALNLSKKTDLEKLLHKVEKVLEVLQDEKTAKEKRIKELSDPTEWPEYLRELEEQKNSKVKFVVSNEKIRTAFKFLKQKGEVLLKEWNEIGYDRKARGLAMQILEVLNSLELNFKIPSQDFSILGVIAKIAVQSTTTNIGNIDDGEAKNIPDLAVGDLSKIDPSDSSLWRSPKNIENLNLTWGFDRAGPMASGADLCEYSEPKSSYGTHPGFKIKCGKKENKKTLKVKFGEERSESFSGRVLNVLGYNLEVVDPLNYVVEANDSLADLSVSTKNILRLKYDRRILSELHERKPLLFHLMLLPGFFTLMTANPTESFNIDPFLRVQRAYLKKYIKGAKTDGDGGWYVSGFEKDGNSLDLKKLIIKNPHLHSDPLASRDEKNYAENDKDLIDQLVMSSLQVQEDLPGNVRVGPWDWNALGHDRLREARGLGLIAAWMGWNDVRFDNNRLVIEKDQDKNLVLKHYLTDTGSVLGESQSVVKQGSQDPERFPWSITLGEPQVNDSSNITHHFQVVRYNTTLDPCSAFQKMSLSDARWGARLIARLSKKQIEQALIGSGFSAAEVVLLREKLLLRRYMTLRDLDLAQEYPEIETGPAVKQLSKLDERHSRSRKVHSACEHNGTSVECQVNYDPTKEAQLEAEYWDENKILRKLSPAPGKQKVVNGNLVDLNLGASQNKDFRKRH